MRGSKLVKLTKEVISKKEINKTGMSNQSVVMGLSGGADSSCLMGWLLAQGYSVHGCVFCYGSKHNKYENEAAKKVVQFYELEFSDRVSISFHDLSLAIKGFQSSLLISGDSIPEGSYDDESMKQTVVPGRNLIFSSVMAGLAESIEASYIALGVHSGDHLIYPDCRIEFIKALDSTIYLSSDRKVQIITPFENFDKAEILKIGYDLTPEVPYQLTRTCYKDQPLSCGKCGSCNERLEAFDKIDMKDPINYE